MPGSDSRTIDPTEGQDPLFIRALKRSRGLALQETVSGQRGSSG